MELWIRSQDRKKLCKVTNLHIKTYTTYDNYGSYEQIAILSDNIVLGDYEEQRALEVLNEIQIHLLKMGKTEMLTSVNGIINGIKDYGIVYEMPKE